MKGHKIITEHVYPPIPERAWDWRATFDDYDGAPDAHCPIGYGPTEISAIADLMEQEEERLLRGAPGFGGGWHPSCRGDVEQ